MDLGMGQSFFIFKAVNPFQRSAFCFTRGRRQPAFASALVLQR
jgi:hypothetical protein